MNKKTFLLIASLMTLAAAALFGAGCGAKDPAPDAVPPPTANAKPAPTMAPGQGVIQGPAPVGGVAK